MMTQIPAEEEEEDNEWGGGGVEAYRGATGLLVTFIRMGDVKSGGF